MLKGDVKAALAGGEHALVEMTMATHAGMTTGEFESLVIDWITAAKHPKSFISLDSADHLLTRRDDAVYVADLIAVWSGRYLAAAQ